MDLIRNLYARFRVLIHEVAKFGVVGVLAFLITLRRQLAALGRDSARSPQSRSPPSSPPVLLSFFGNKLWAFRHREGSRLAGSVLFFIFNGIGLLIQLAFVSAATHALGLNDKSSYNVANILGIGVATLFRLYTYAAVGLHRDRRGNSGSPAAGAGDLENLTGF